MQKIPKHLRLIKTFQKTLLLCLKAAMLVLLFGIFYVFYMQDSIELMRGINRVSAIVSSTFIVLCYVMIRVYGGYSIGSKQTHEIVLSMLIAVLITDIFTYVQLCIMEKMIMRISVLLVIFAVQAVAITVVTKTANNLYFTVNPPKRLIIIYSDKSTLDSTLHKLRLYQNKFKIMSAIKHNDPEIHRFIRLSHCVMLIDLPSDVKESIVEYCYKHGKVVYFNPTISDILINHSSHDLVDDISLLGYDNSNPHVEQMLIKRAVDFVFSLIAALITLPIMIFEAVAIKIEDGGPIFYKQERVTKGGKLFNVLKFRTMMVNAEKNGAVLAQKNDSRITKTGVFLRKTRLDELPQLFNILKGDMSIVGPRPERPSIVAEYKKDLPEFSYRLRVKAGLTGLAQILGNYDTSPKDKLILDLLYIEKYSLRLDLKIMFQTIIVCISHSG